jgi:hypothetical protein
VFLIVSSFAKKGGIVMLIRTFHSFFRLTFTAVAAAAAIALVPFASFADTVHVADDAYTKADKPDENKGSDKKVEVKDAADDKDRIGFAKFDFSTLPSGVVSDDIVQATLRMWIEKVDRAGDIEVRRVDEFDWDEHSITANSAPSHTFETSFGVTTADKDHFVTVDVTDLVKDWVDGLVNPFDNNFGIALAAVGANVKIGSKETDKKHEMQIEVALGETGAVGPQGEQGKLGLQGEQGKLGPQGEQGKLGPQGEQGKLGLQGEQGKLGPQGQQGVQGKIGPLGPKGIVSISTVKNPFSTFFFDGTSGQNEVSCPAGSLRTGCSGACGIVGPYPGGSPLPNAIRGYETITTTSKPLSCSQNCWRENDNGLLIVVVTAYCAN